MSTDIKQMLALHAKWLRGETDGTRADLPRADLPGANLPWWIVQFRALFAAQKEGGK